MFGGVSVLWGIPYLFIKVAVDDGVPPAFLAWVRVILAAALLLAIAWRAGTLATVRGHWRWLCAFAVAEVTIPFPLIAAGEQHITSSLAAIIIATAPLFVALLAIRFDASERVNGRRLAGLVIGLSGVVALVGIDVAGRALVITYINPVVAVGLGVAILDERPGAGAIAGLLLILAGSWLSTDGRLPPGLSAVFSRQRRRDRAVGVTPAQASPRLQDGG